MWKLIILFIVGYIAYKLCIGSTKKGFNEDGQASGKGMASDLIKDPICGVYVDKESALKIKDSSGMHYFCSYDCRDKYLKQNK